MSDPARRPVLTFPAANGPVVFVTQVGAATGSRTAAAALTCIASEPDRPALLIDLDNGRALRSTLVATVGARELEERLVAHLPDAAVASRGRICHLKLPGGPEGIAQIAVVLPLVRDSTGVIHLPPRLLRTALESSRIRPTAALLRADLTQDRALTALAARDLMSEGLRVVVLKGALGWIAARTALLGMPLGAGGALPRRSYERLLRREDKRFRQCYSGKDESKDEPREVWAEQSRP